MREEVIQLSGQGTQANLLQLRGQTIVLYRRRSSGRVHRRSPDRAGGLPRIELRDACSGRETLASVEAGNEAERLRTRRVVYCAAMPRGCSGATHEDQIHPAVGSTARSGCRPTRLARRLPPTTLYFPGSVVPVGLPVWRASLCA